MNLFGVSLLILSICIILGQSKPRGHPKKCSDDIDCNPGYACKFIKKLGFKLCAKPKHHQEGGPSFRSSKLSDLTRAAAPIADEPGSGPPPQNARNGAPKKGGAPPSSNLEEPVEGGNAGADGPKPPYPQDGDPEVEEPEAGQPEEDSEYGPEGEDYPADADSEVPEEEGDPKGEDSEIGENGKYYFLKIYKGTKLASATSTMALVVFLPHHGNSSSNMFCNVGSRPKSMLKVKDFCHLLWPVLDQVLLYAAISILASPTPFWYW